MSASKSMLPLQIVTLALVLLSCVMTAIVGYWVASGILAVTAVLNVISMVRYRRSRAREAARAAREAASSVRETAAV